MEVLLAAGGVHVAVVSVVSAQMLECNSPWQWMCNSGECIAQYDLCNGIAQCSDASDEADCALRNSQQNYMGVPREEQMKPSTSKSTVQNLSTPATSFFNIPSIDDARWLAFVAVAILLFIAFICVRFRRKRGSTNNRAYGMRHRNNMDEDEDDLLISSMYS